MHEAASKLVRRITSQNLLEVTSAENRATGIGWVVHNQASCSVVHQRFHLLQVNFPGLFWLMAKWKGG